MTTNALLIVINGLGALVLFGAAAVSLLCCAAMALVLWRAMAREMDGYDTPRPVMRRYYTEDCDDA